MLGVSRGTLRTALQRLEESGEIVRRQGSGTFVGHVTLPTAFDEGLERLESYSSLARRRGVALSLRALHIERSPVGPEAAREFDLSPEAVATTVLRVLLANGEPAAVMTDVVHPATPLPADARLRRALERGDMMLDVLLEQGVPIAFANTRVIPRLIGPRDREGKMLGVQRTTAVLELEETMHLTSGEAVQHSRDLFAPGGLDLHVVRWLAVQGSPQVNPAGPDEGLGGRRGRLTPTPRGPASPPPEG